MFKTIYKGVGLRATADFPVETFIMEYVGEVLSESQFHKCAKKYSKNDTAGNFFGPFYFVTALLLKLL